MSVQKSNGLEMSLMVRVEFSACYAINPTMHIEEQAENGTFAISCLKFRSYFQTDGKHQQTSFYDQYSEKKKKRKEKLIRHL